MKKYLVIDASNTWWVEYWVDGMLNSDNQKILAISSKTSTAKSTTDIVPELIPLGLYDKVGTAITEVELKTKCAANNWTLQMTYEQSAPVVKLASAVMEAPTDVVLSVGAVNPVGGVTNVAIPAAGATDDTGAVTDWVTGTADSIAFTVTDAENVTSTITINDEDYVSGDDYVIAEGVTELTIVVTSTQTNYKTQIRTFVVSVAAAV